MSLTLVLIDARPAFAPAGPAAPSTLCLPLGRGTLLDHLAAGRAAGLAAELAVLSPRAADEAYRAALAAAGGAAGVSAVVAHISELFERCETADWLLMVDAARCPLKPLPERELRRAMLDPRVVTHFLAAGDQPAHAQERVCVDAAGRVTRIERYYRGVTSPGAPASCCCMLSGAAARGLSGAPLESVAAVRRAAASSHHLSRDVLLDEPACDWCSEAGVLASNEAWIRRHTPRDGWRAPGVDIAPSARLCGPVIVQAGAQIAADALVLGPAVLGAGARVGGGAVIAQSVVAGGAAVPDGALVHQRIVLAERLPADAPPRPAAGEPQPPGAPSPAGPPADDRDLPDAAYVRLKWLADTVIALAVVIVLSPLFLLTALLIKLDSRGPVLYGDRREGKGGAPFRCWKFRTMVPGADVQQRRLYQRNQVDGPQFKLERDTRVTRVGRWLRRTNIDELPQLFNVVLGQMSLIGPRPSPFRENQICVPWRRARLSVRPGITGLWQICRHERAYGDFHQWIQYDMLYVRHLSFALDMKIFVATLLTLGARWPVPLRWLVPAEPLRDDDAPLPQGAAILET